VGATNNWIEEISTRECVELLRNERIGRIGVSVQGRPEIFPVDYSMDASGRIVFRSGVGMKLDPAINHHVVFEVDRFDEDGGCWWSVVVHGVAHHTERVADGESPLTSFSDDTPHVIRISHSSVSGRRIRGPARPSGRAPLDGADIGA
jgi:nitroimidazol reductase NimA-like FMN-containing flavoprotein (pyridoxamine 5'-phosphate oxidase superfamily)